MLAALLILTLSHDAVARGDLRRLERFADRLDLVVAPSPGNLLSDAAVSELRRWPGLVTVELQLPLRRPEAAQLRKLRRFAARLPPGQDPKSASRDLKLLAPALIQINAAPPPPTAPGPCQGTTLSGGDPPELRSTTTGGECLPTWLSSRLDLHPEGLGDPPPSPDAGLPRTKRTP